MEGVPSQSEDGIRVRRCDNPSAQEVTEVEETAQQVKKNSILDYYIFCLSMLNIYISNQFSPKLLVSTIWETEEQRKDVKFEW